MVEYAFVLHRMNNLECEKRELRRAKLLACAALGLDHPYAAMITKKLAILDEEEDVQTSAPVVCVDNLDGIASSTGTGSKRRKVGLK